VRVYAANVYMGQAGGRQLRGIDDASRFYHRKPASQLTPAEAAMLESMIRSPNFLSPLRNPERARAIRC
jgi:membrane peptidoglycan carboxypeptidase